MMDRGIARLPSALLGLKELGCCILCNEHSHQGKKKDVSKVALLQRLQGIAQAAARSGHALAVLGLGSAGLEYERLDEYSDLDVWIIVEDGYKQLYVNDLSWLSIACPIPFKFKHSPSGYGLLFADGIFAEVDIFEVTDLTTLDFAEARIIWKAPEVSDTIRLPQRQPRTHERAPQEMLGEALGNLYVGLGRYYRGEKLSAMRFIQVYAVDQILKLVHLIETEQAFNRDLFSHERRFEVRFPIMASELANLMQGYKRTPESAQAILEFLDKHFAVDAAIKQAIEARLAEHLAV